MTMWTSERVAEISAWVEAAYPDEGCGLIMRRASGEIEVLKCENLAEKYHALDPEMYPRTARTFYIINPAEFIRAERRGDEVLVIFHSHADVGDYFSDEDVAGATMPRVDGDGGPEPSHPGVDFLVVSVREGAADHATLFTFDADAPRAWRAALEMKIGAEGVEVLEG